LQRKIVTGSLKRKKKNRDTCLLESNLSLEKADARKKAILTVSRKSAEGKRRQAILGERKEKAAQKFSHGHPA